MAERMSGDCDRDLAGGDGCAGLLGQMIEELVTALAGDFYILRAEGAADALLGEGRGVHGVVQEPRAVIVPQVVVEVFLANADTGEFGDGRHDA